MHSRQRLITALKGNIADRLPVTTHHVMPYFLENTMGGMSAQEFFEYFGIDPVLWVFAHKPDPMTNDFIDKGQGELGFLEPIVLCSENWQISRELKTDSRYKTCNLIIHTPEKTLSMILQEDEITIWVKECLLKEKSDIEIFAKYAPVPLCDVKEVNRQVESYGNTGIIRGAVPGFDLYGQPGCWQDAAVLIGVEQLIMAAFEDPVWVHEVLHTLMDRKLRFLSSAKGANYDLLEFGGGSASSTVISPAMFEEFVAPYDTRVIEQAHDSGQRIVYHTCGGMMPILEMIAAMNPDAMETFTPPAMGGDVDLKEAKRRIGDKLCMIGGFDQHNFFKDCDSDETRKAVRKCFEEAGEGGAFILAPSDHFFEADIECLKAFADEARKCTYS